MDKYDSTDRPAGSYLLFGVACAGIWVASAGIVVAIPWLVILGMILILGCMGMFWLGASARD